MKNTWQLQEAKSKFSELVERALAHGVQVVTRHGQKTVVILPYEQYQQLTRRTGSLAQFLIDSPLRGSGLEIERDKSTPRDFDIEP